MIVLSFFSCFIELIITFYPNTSLFNTQRKLTTPSVCAVCSSDRGKEIYILRSVLTEQLALFNFVRNSAEVVARFFFLASQGT